MHWVWMGSELPDEYYPFLAQWKRLHPDWQFAAWNEHNLRDNVLAGTPKSLFDRAPDLVAGNAWQFRSDVARYALLLRYGGVYVDVDTEPQKCLDELLMHDCWLAWEEQDKWIGNTYMGARPANPFISQLVRGLQDSVGAHQGLERANVVSGPQYVTKQHKEYEGTPVALLPQQDFYPYAFNELYRRHEEFPDAWAVHHWHNQRVLHRIPL